MSETLMELLTEEQRTELITIILKALMEEKAKQMGTWGDRHR